MRLSTWKIYWWRIRSRGLRLWYRWRYGIDCGCGIDSGSLLPQTGKGQFVSVWRKGDYLDIVNESDERFIRLIPSYPHHGVMVESWSRGRLLSRGHQDFKAFWRGVEHEVEESCRHLSVAEHEAEESQDCVSVVDLNGKVSLVASNAAGRFTNVKLSVEATQSLIERLQDCQKRLGAGNREH